MIRHLVLMNDLENNQGRLAALVSACGEGRQVIPIELGNFMVCCGPDAVRFGFVGLGPCIPDGCVMLGKASRSRESEWACFCLEASGLRVDGVGRSDLRSNKLGDAFLFAVAGARQPRSFYASVPVLRRVFSRVREILGPALVGKAIGLTGRGAGVSLLHDLGDFDRLVSSTPGTHHFLLQEYLPGRLDLRVWVVGGRALCCHRRRLVDGEFRSNACFGTVSEDVDPGPEVLRQCEAVAAIWANSVLAIDLLLDEDGPWFLETNTSANFAISPASAEIARAVLSLESSVRLPFSMKEPAAPFILQEAASLPTW